MTESIKGKLKGCVKRPFMGNTEGQFSLEFVIKFAIKITRLIDVDHQKIKPVMVSNVLYESGVNKLTAQKQQYALNSKTRATVSQENSRVPEPVFGADTFLFSYASSDSSCFTCK